MLLLNLVLFVLFLSSAINPSLGCTLGTIINALSLLGGLTFGSRPSAPVQLTISKRPPCVCLLLSLQTSRAGVCITERYQWPRPLSTISFISGPGIVSQHPWFLEILNVKKRYWE